MIYTLRDYQQEASFLAVKHLKSKEKRNPMIVLGTGTGKSLVIADIAMKIGKVLVFQPRKEILEQNYIKYCSYGFSANIYSASAGRKDIGNVTFATIGTAIKKPHLFDHFKYIIVDECHYVNAAAGQYKEFFDKTKAKILGLTATPYRVHVNTLGTELRFLTRTRQRVFHDLLYYTQNIDMYNKGYLCDLTYYPVKLIDSGKLVVNSTGQDYTDRSIIAHYEDIHFKEELLNIVQRLLKAGRKHILVFTRFVREAIFCADQLQCAEWVSGETPKRDRERILNAFKSGEIKVVFNAMVLVVGFDFPALDTIVLGRDTRSLTLYYQMVGRGVRPYKDKETWCIDLGGSYHRFGHIYNLRIGRDYKGKHAVFSRNDQLTNKYL